MNKRARCAKVCLGVFACATLASCKVRTDPDWTDSDIQSLSGSMAHDTVPPEHILARVMMAERETALRIINTWARVVNATERKNPNSVLNQIRRMFNPDYLKQMSLQEALQEVRKEGSGRHGSAQSQRRPQDHAYHALWSRIADAAGFVGYSRSAKHMRHYLANKGHPIHYTATDTQRILDDAGRARNTDTSPVEAQFISSQIQIRGKALGAEPSASEADMIANMSQRQMAFYLSRIKIFSSLGEFARSNKINSAEILIKALNNIKTKNFPARGVGAQGDWRLHRPIGKHYALETSEAQTDLYYALGSFTSIFSSTPIDLRAENGTVKVRFAQSISIFDKYNWDSGKFVTLFSGWCWKLNSDNCSHIEELTSLSVSDKSIGRLHALGLAKEFNIHGQTSISTVWDSVRFDDLLSPQKERIWTVLEKTVSEFLMPVNSIPD